MARCLRKAKEPLFLVGVDMDPTYLPLCPVDVSYVVPAASDPETYIAALAHLTEKLHIDFLYPQKDQEVLILAQHRERFPGKLWLPPADVIALSQDKEQCRQFLAKQGVPVPVGLLLEREHDLALLQEKGLDTLCWVRKIRGSGSEGARLCRSIEEVRVWVSENNGWGNFMASEFLPGRIFGWDSIWKDGVLLACQAKERLRYGMETSPSPRSKYTTAIRSVHEPHAEEVAQRAVTAIMSKPDGIFTVDMRENAQGQPMVTEINAGRFLTSSTILFEKTGFLFPYDVVNINLGNMPEHLPCHHPVHPGQYILAGILADPILCTERDFQIPSWREA
jgi:carbamoyl-phosphate synthase large subunit